MNKSDLSTLLLLRSSNTVWTIRPSRIRKKCDKFVKSFRESVKRRNDVIYSSKPRWGDNTRVGFKEIKNFDVKWIDPAQDKI